MPAPDSPFPPLVNPTDRRGVTKLYPFRPTHPPSATGDEVFAVYPETTSFYLGTIATQPKRGPSMFLVFVMLVLTSRMDGCFLVFMFVLTSMRDGVLLL